MFCIITFWGRVHETWDEKDQQAHKLEGKKQSMKRGKLLAQKRKRLHGDDLRHTLHTEHL